MNWNDLRLRLRALFLRRRTEDDLAEELQFHLDMQARKHVAAGAGATEASRNAHIDFGGLSRTTEECRDARGTQWIETLGRDISYAARGFRRTPAFALTVIVTIALGLGLNTALFTVFNAYALRPLAVRDPYSLYRFSWTNKAGAGHWFSWRQFEDFRKESPAFSEVIGREQLMTRLEDHMMIGNLVTGNYFSMLGVRAELGRTLLPSDTRAPGSEPVIVLSHTAWVNKLGSDPNILGKKLLVHGYPLEVIGVAAVGFNGLSEVPLDFWAPLTMSPALQDNIDLFGAKQPERIRISGRLREDTSTRQAEAALAAWSRRLTLENPEAEKSAGVTLTSEATMIPLIPEVLAAAAPVFLMFGLVLLIACANVANMMLARAMSRQREIGIRLAMGAGRARLIRQLLTESILLSLPAALAGFAVAQATIGICTRAMFATLPHGYQDYVPLVPLSADIRVFGYMLVGAVASALLFGLLPAMQATRVNVMQAARGEFTTDVRPTRLGNTLVIGQVAISVLFLICAAVSLRANSRLHALNVGLKVDNVIGLVVQPKFRGRVLHELSTNPSVELVASTSKIPFDGSLHGVPVRSTQGSEIISSGYIYVSPEYFQVFQLPILRGRGFIPDEANSGSPIVVISQATAQRLWPGSDAVGQTLRVTRDASRRYVPSTPPNERVTVIGVARDAVNGYIGYGIDSTCIYFPSAQPASYWSEILNQTSGDYLLVRMNGNAETARRALSEALAKSVPGGVEQIYAMKEFQAALLYPFQALYWMSSAVGGLALLLTLSGIYGVLSYFVTQRTKEIGIRVALGASTRLVAGLVLKQSLRLTGIGVCLGSLAALAASQVLASQADLFMFDGFDVVAYVTGGGVALVAAACAAYLPARRAARIEPSITLRYD